MIRHRRRRLLLCSGALCAAVVIGAACTFPDVTFTPVTGDGAPEEAGDGGSTTDSTTDSTTTTDGPDFDAVVSDAGRKVDACAADACDCDEDGFFDKNKPACLVDGSPGDCVDTDSRYKPNQGFTSEPEEPPFNGDWNCDGKVETLIPVNIKCSDTATGGVCDAKYGFTDKPSCGATGGRYVTCKTVCGLPIIGCECRENGPPRIDVKQACK